MIPVVNELNWVNFLQILRCSIERKDKERNALCIRCIIISVIEILALIKLTNSLSI